MHDMLEATLKFTNVPFLRGGNVYIKEEMQEPDMLSSALQMFLSDSLSQWPFSRRKPLILISIGIRPLRLRTPKAGSCLRGGHL